jgi:hypothetical protein
MLWPPSRSKPCLVDPRTRSLGGHRRHPSVRLRRRVRSGKAPAGDRGLPMPAPRPPEGGSLLLCRPEPRREEARQPRKAATPRPEDEVFRPEHLDRTHNGVRVLGLWLRGGAGEGLDRDAPEGAGARGTGQPRASLPIRGRHTRLGGGREAAQQRREAARATGAVAVVAWPRRSRAGPRPSLFGGLMLAASIWSTPSASSSKASGGASCACAIPSKPTGGRGWWWPLSPSSGWRAGACGRSEAAMGEALRPRPLDTTPARVPRALSALLGQLGTPAKPPKPCGRSPGRPKGRLSGRAKRYPAIKKSA